MIAFDSKIAGENVSRYMLLAHLRDEEKRIRSEIARLTRELASQIEPDKSRRIDL
jgi:hypothetical protein